MARAACEVLEHNAVGGPDHSIVRHGDEKAPSGLVEDLVPDALDRRRVEVRVVQVQLSEEVQHRRQLLTPRGADD